MDGVPKYGNDSKISHKSAILGHRIIHKKWKSDWGNDSPFFGVCVCSLTPTNMVTMGNLGMGLPHYMDIWYVGFVFQGLRNRLKSVVTLICLPAEIPLTVNLIKANHQVLPLFLVIILDWWFQVWVCLKMRDTPQIGYTGALIPAHLHICFNPRHLSKHVLPSPEQMCPLEI